MRTLGRLARKPMPSMQPLPWNFPQWEADGIRPRRATVTMIAATSAAGKTMIATKLIEKFKEPTLFFSADTDEGTMLTRAGAMVTGDTQDEVRQGFLEDGADHYGELLAEAFEHVRFVFETDPTYDDLELETAAMAEVYGEFPKIIVVDNLMNLVGENENEFGSMRDHTKAFKRLCRVTGAAVLVLHHMKEESSNPHKPAPKRHVQGRISQLPEVMISIAASENGDAIRASGVKNRFGKSDPEANHFVEIPVDLDRVQFYANDHMKQIGMSL